MNWKDIDWKKGLKWGAIAGGGAVVASQLGKVIRGLIIGVILIGIAMLLTWMSVKSIKENSKTVEGLELRDIEDLSADNGELVKVSGEITPSQTQAVEIALCEDSTCNNPKEIPTKYEDLIYYDLKYEQLQVVEKKETITDSNGNERVETTYEEEWVRLSDSSKDSWSDLKIGEYSMQPEEAKILIDKQNETVNNVYLSNAPSVQTYGQNVSSNIGDIRAKVNYIKNDDRNYIVVGEIQGDSIVEGESFIISDKSEKELISSLKTEERTQRWGLRIAAFIILTIGLTSMLSPVLVFTDLIPIVGNAARSIATFVSAIISFIVVTLTVLVLNFWWVFFIILIILLAFLIKKLMEGKDKDSNLQRLQA